MQINLSDDGLDPIDRPTTIINRDAGSVRYAVGTQIDRRLMSPDGSWDILAIAESREIAEFLVACYKARFEPYLPGQRYAYWLLEG